MARKRHDPQPMIDRALQLSRNGGGLVAYGGYFRLDHVKRRLEGYDVSVRIVRSPGQEDVRRDKARFELRVDPQPGSESTRDDEPRCCGAGNFAELHWPDCRRRSDGT